MSCTPQGTRCLQSRSSRGIRIGTIFDAEYFSGIKYRAILQAQERTVTSVDALLVSERGLPADLTRLVKMLGVSTLRIDATS